MLYREFALLSHNYTKDIIDYILVGTHGEYHQKIN